MPVLPKGKNMKKGFLGILIFYVVGISVAAGFLCQNEASFINTIQALTISTFGVLILIAIGIFLAKLISILANRRRKDRLIKNRARNK